MRASPDLDPVAMTADQARPDKRKPEARIAKFLLRMAPDAKRICEEAAMREGLSLNAWAYRVLVEHAKRSRDGWRSIPIGDEPARTRATSPNTIYVGGGGGGGSSTFSSGGVVSGGNVISGGSSKFQGTVKLDLNPPTKDLGHVTVTPFTFTPPDSDIPDLM